MTKRGNIIAEWINNTFAPKKAQPRNRIGQYVKYNPKIFFYGDMRKALKV